MKPKLKLLKIAKNTNEEKRIIICKSLNDFISETILLEGFYNDYYVTKQLEENIFLNCELKKVSLENPNRVVIDNGVFKDEEMAVVMIERYWKISNTDDNVDTASLPDKIIKKLVIYKGDECHC